MKILFYNWLQFDDVKVFGGGVNIYQKNLIDYLINHTSHEIYFLSGGLKYNPFRDDAYIEKTTNIFGDKCHSFVMVNSPLLAPALYVAYNPETFLDDNITLNLFEKFVEEQGGFDVIHLNNIEGISINVLKLKEKFPEIKIVYSMHNYVPICPAVQYFQDFSQKICNDFHDGKDCLQCIKNVKFKTRDYLVRIRDCFNAPYPLNKLFAMFFWGKAKKFVPEKASDSEVFAKYRKYNINMLNKYADLVLAVSERVRQIAINNGIDEKIVKTSYIGTKFAENTERKYKTDNSDFQIVYLGYPRKDKGFYFMIEALSKLDKNIASSVSVKLAVPNCPRELVNDKLKNFKKVTVINGYKHSELRGLLSDVDLGLVPVLWEDNLPQVAIEMIASGVPVLSSSFGGASELCDSELFKYRGGDVQDFLDKLSAFIKAPELLNKYWSHNKKLVTMAEHVKELETLYSSRASQSMEVLSRSV